MDTVAHQWQHDDEQTRLLANAEAIGTLPSESVKVIARIAQDLIWAKDALLAARRRTAETARWEETAGHLVEQLDVSDGKRASLEAKLSAIVKWLEANQSDVFRRGLWDAINMPLPAPPEVK